MKPECSAGSVVRESQSAAASRLSAALDLEENVVQVAVELVVVPSFADRSTAHLDRYGTRELPAEGVGGLVFQRTVDEKFVDPPAPRADHSMPGPVAIGSGEVRMISVAAPVKTHRGFAVIRCVRSSRSTSADGVVSHQTRGYPRYLAPK